MGMQTDEAYCERYFSHYSTGTSLTVIYILSGGQTKSGFLLQSPVGGHQTHPFTHEDHSDRLWLEQSIAPCFYSHIVLTPSVQGICSRLIQRGVFAANKTSTAMVILLSVVERTFSAMKTYMERRSGRSPESDSLLHPPLACSRQEGFRTEKHNSKLRSFLTTRQKSNFLFGQTNTAFKEAIYIQNP